MSVVSELMRLPGVVAAGEYSYRGDRYSYEGKLDDEMARMASIMCRATSMGVHMEGDMLGDYCDNCGLVPTRGWAVKGPKFAVCVMANVFCFLDVQAGSLNDAIRTLQRNLADVPDHMI
jgi:roadblock/LC7 domain-containing protein